MTRRRRVQRDERTGSENGWMDASTRPPLPTSTYSTYPLAMLRWTGCFGGGGGRNHL